MYFDRPLNPSDILHRAYLRYALRSYQIEAKLHFRLRVAPLYWGCTTHDLLRSVGVCHVWCAVSTIAASWLCRRILLCHACASVLWLVENDSLAFHLLIETWHVLAIISYLLCNSMWERMVIVQVNLVPISSIWRHWRLVVKGNCVTEKAFTGLALLLGGRPFPIEILLLVCIIDINTHDTALHIVLLLEVGNDPMMRTEHVHVFYWLVSDERNRLRVYDLWLLAFDLRGVVFELRRLASLVLEVERNFLNLQSIFKYIGLVFFERNLLEVHALTIIPIVLMTACTRFQLTQLVQPRLALFLWV